MRGFLVAVVVGCGSLAGCNSTPVNQLTFPEVQAIARRIDATCLKEGGPPKSQGYSTCVRFYAQREHGIRAANRERQARFGQALSEASDNFARQQQANAAIAAANRPIDCTSRYTPAGTVRTSCY